MLSKGDHLWQILSTAEYLIWDQATNQHTFKRTHFERYRTILQNFTINALHKTNYETQKTRYMLYVGMLEFEFSISWGCWFLEPLLLNIAFKILMLDYIRILSLKISYQQALRLSIHLKVVDWYGLNTANNTKKYDPPEIWHLQLPLQD